MELHLHPDNLVIIRDAGAILYVDSIENFALDYGEAIESVVGWNERQYIPGVMNRLCDGFTQETTTDEWVQGEDILDSVGAIQAAKAVRIAGV